MTSPTSFGTSLTPQDIEARFQLIENAIAQLMPANFTASTSNVTASIQNVAPDVSGFTGVKIVNGIQFSWNPVTASNLSTYELEISTSHAFLGASAIQVGQVTTYNFSTGSPNTTYFARIRAVIGNRKGNWSKTFNSQTGLIETGNIDVGATHSLVQDVTLSFDPATLSAAGVGSSDSGAYGQAQITTTGGIVVPFSQFTNDVASVYGGPGPNRITMDFLRDGVTIDSAVTDSNSGFTGRLTFSAFGLPDVPPAGAHLYQARITIETNKAGNSLGVTPIRLILSLTEFK